MGRPGRTASAPIRRTGESGRPDPRRPVPPQDAGPTVALDYRVEMTHPALPHGVALYPEGDFKMEYMLMPLKRFFDFSGRSRRKEFWLWWLLYIIIYIVVMVLDVQLGLGGSGSTSSNYGDGSVGASASFNGGILTLVWALVAL